MMNNNNLNRQSLYEAIRELSFSVLECALFLDTHPDDNEAIAYYNDRCDELENAVEAYEAHFGPLTIAGGTGGDGWDWIEGPWPWENAANMTDKAERSARRQN